VATQSPQEFDVIVLGSGPGGEGAAMRATKAGKKVAVVEKYREVGGGCTHWATIPSKALRQAVRSLHEFRHNPLFSDAMRAREITFPRLLRSASAVIHGQVDHPPRLLRPQPRPRVPRPRPLRRPAHDRGRGPSGARPRLRAAGFVIATGSRPYRPPDVDFSHPRIFDSDTILGLDHTPQSITDLRRRRGRLRVRVDLPRPRGQGQPDQQPRQAARPSSTTRSSTRSATTCATRAC
jgi:NAD(P) transhydrogenase